MNLDAIIAEKIRQQGPISIADYMQLALASPEHGYYMRKDPFGAEGDFTTAPEISQIFGELMGAWLANAWLHMQKPECALIELGPGRGTLMADVLRATKHVAGFQDAISIHLVETSPALKQKQWKNLAGKHPRLSWHESIDELPKDVPWLLVANEFFDALPIRQFVYQDKNWLERFVSLDAENALAFTTRPYDDTNEAIESFLSGHIQASKLENGDIVEYNEPALACMKSLAVHIATVGGAALVIDYGYAFSGIGDSLQAVKRHRHHPPLLEPGVADLTAHVDFSMLAKTAKRTGAHVHGPVAQGEFLGRLGAIPRAVALCEHSSPEQQAQIIGSLRRLLDPEQMGELFKVLCIGNAKLPAPEGFR